MQRLQSIANQITQNQTADLFSHVPQAPEDVILGVAAAYKKSTDPNKINLGIGAYRDEEGNPYVFQIVRKVEKEIADLTMAGKLNKEYSPIEGDSVMFTECAKLIFGEQSPILDRVASVQCLSGTGALRVGFEFVKSFLPSNVFYPNPTWANHVNIINDAGLKGYKYTYYDPKTRGLDFEGFKKDLINMAPGSIVLLHVCAHNPTGVDLTTAQWKETAKIFKEKQLFPFFDSAYQGFASGDLEQDRQSVQIFLDEGIQLCVAQSMAKNMGLYGERAGAFHIVCTDVAHKNRVLSQIKAIVRPMYSNPPLHGARIVARILSNPQNKAEWIAEMKSVSQRITSMRTLLRDELVKIGTKGTWDHIVNQIGMFSYTGLSPKQCEVLTNKYHIYLINNGRISMAGVTKKNIPYLAKAIKDAVENH